MKEFHYVQDQETTNTQETESTREITTTQETIALATQQQNNTRKAPKKTGYCIYIRSERKWIPVDKEYYETYMRGIHAFRNRQYRQGFCKCPGTKEYMCDCDCLTCPFYKKDVFVSLDAPIFDDEGNEETLMDRLMDEDTLSPEEALLVKDEHESLYRAIEQLNDTQQMVIHMLLEEKTQAEIAEALGIKTQSTVSFHKDRAVEALRKILIVK